MVESQYKWLGHSIDGWTIAQVVGSQYRLFHSLSHNKHHKRITKEYKNQHIVKWLGHSAGGWATAQVVGLQYKWLGHSTGG